VRTCLLLFLVSSGVPWFPQVKAIHTYLGAFTLQVACSSTKNYKHISLLSSPSIPSISVIIWTPKHVLGSFLAILFGTLALNHVLFGSSSPLQDLIGSSSFSIDLFGAFQLLWNLIGSFAFLHLLIGSIDKKHLVCTTGWQPVLMLLQDTTDAVGKNINIIFVMWGPGNIFKSLKLFTIVKLGLELCSFTFVFCLSLSSFTFRLSVSCFRALLLEFSSGLVLLFS